MAEKICNSNGADMQPNCFLIHLYIFQNRLTKRTVPDFSQFSGKLEHELACVKNSQCLENLAKLPPVL